MMTTAVLWIVLGLFFNVSFFNILATSSVLTALSYLGDIFILPRIGNTTAAIADFVLAWVAIWLLGSTLFAGTIALGTASFISALALTAGEIFFHRYLRNQVFHQNNSENKIAYFPIQNLQTEFSSEIEESEGKPSNPEK